MMFCWHQGWRPQRGFGTTRVYSWFRHIACLGWVINVYVFDVNYVLVYLGAWWLFAIDESYTCANMVDDNFWRCSIMNNEILCYFNSVYLFYYDWCEANPSCLWWTAYLFVWMGRRHAGLVDLHCLLSCLRIAGASSVYFVLSCLTDALI